MGHVLSVKGSWTLLQRQGGLCVAVVAILLISPLTIEAQDTITYFLQDQREYLCCHCTSFLIRSRSLGDCTWRDVERHVRLSHDGKFAWHPPSKLAFGCELGNSSWHLFFLLFKEINSGAIDGVQLEIW
jgi:hypothetical protein